MAADAEKVSAAGQPEDTEPRDIDLATQIAHETDNAKYSPWTWHMIRLYMILSVAYLCGCLNGYDGSLMGGLDGMTGYRNYFHM